MRIKVDLRLLYVALALVVFAVIVYLLNGHLQRGPAQQPLPQSIAFAVEYFNEQYSNQTLLVPSQYYSQVSQLMRNNNLAVENDTDYAESVFGTGRPARSGFALIDLNELDNLSYFYGLIGETAPKIYEFSGNYSVQNYSATYQRCLSFRGTADAFYVCGVFFGGVDVGNATLIAFPGNSTLYIANGTEFLIPSATSTDLELIRTSVSGAERVYGIMFSYLGLASFYIPPALLGTAFGRNEFLRSNSTVSNFWGSEIIKLS
ncbi:MAG: hypothetical protein QXS81_03960 [Candidatus Micrarchaeaceae archaeon]